MRPNFFHSSSFPYNHHHQELQFSDEGTSSFHSRPRVHLEHQLMSMESLSSPSSMNYNIEEDESRGASGGGGGGGQETPAALTVEKEHMFDKVVTPSDVGKLNRLVIPKQHAEKYFPLDSSTNEKGLLLNFEDRNGKPWRFRYSYWNSSQSYVMTKGWSRFVKDKKLDAGDIVSFLRGVSEKDRLFIDWRRRPTAPPPPHPHHLFPPQLPPGHHYTFHPWNHHHPPPPPPHPYFLQNRCRDHHPSYNPHHHHNNTSATANASSSYGNPLIYFRSPIPQHQMMVPSGAGIGTMQMQQRAGSTAGGGAIPIPVEAAIDEDSIHDDPMVFESVPVVQGKAAAKRLRLFGVNMDCPVSSDGFGVSEVQTDIILSSTAVHHHHHHHNDHHHHHQPNPPHNSNNNFYLSSSSSSMRAHPYNNVGGGSSYQRNNMYSDNNNKGKGSLSLDFDV